MTGRKLQGWEIGFAGIVRRIRRISPVSCGGLRPPGSLQGRPGHERDHRVGQRHDLPATFGFSLQHWKIGTKHAAASTLWFFILVSLGVTGQVVYSWMLGNWVYFVAQCLPGRHQYSRAGAGDSSLVDQGRTIFGNTMRPR